MNNLIGITINSAFLSYKEKIIFENLSLNIPAGEWTAILGSSGCGKTTLLKMIAGLTGGQKRISVNYMQNTTCKGEISSDSGVPISNLISYMAQDDLLFPWCSILNNVLIGNKLRGTCDEKTKKEARNLLRAVGLGEKIDHYPSSLSGGMRQRVALVRTFMEKKGVVLMDEPFSALDVGTRYKLRELSFSFLKDKTVVLVTHDPLEALALCDNIYILADNPAIVVKNIKLDNDPRPRDISSEKIMKHYASIIDILTSNSEDNEE